MRQNGAALIPPERTEALPEDQLMRIFKEDTAAAWTRALLFAAVGGLACLPSRAGAVPNRYEPGVDPGVGFDLISWANFGAAGEQVWRDAVQSVYDAGFREVSLSPLRFIEQADAGDPPNTSGTIPVPMAGAPSLGHVAAGVTRAKQLGMTVTVNPLVELELFQGGLRGPRSVYSLTPTGAQAGRFWPAYQGYMTEAAQMAQAAGADRLLVGSELKGLSTNAGHKAAWTAMINAVSANFTRPIGYAAAWDEYNNANTTASIWEHPAIDFMGVDAYYPMATMVQADSSGTLPNPAFVEIVREGWNDLLDDEHVLNPSLSGMIEFAAARHGGAGLPIVFTEAGYLPYNRASMQGTAVQTNPAVVDQDEQVMAFDGLLQALDRRLAEDEVLAVNVRQWSMPGSESTPGALWNMFPTTAGHADLNVPATQFLASFVTTPLLLEADFDSDGDVDGADLARWRTGFGAATGATRAAGDANGDGAVNGADFLTWQRQVGTAGAWPASGAVPEPAGAALAVWSLIAALKARRKMQVPAPFGAASGREMSFRRAARHSSRPRLSLAPAEVALARLASWRAGRCVEESASPPGGTPRFGRVGSGALEIVLNADISAILAAAAQGQLGKHGAQARKERRTMKAWQLCAAIVAVAAARGATGRAAEPNESFGAATVLAPGALTVADELTPAVVGFPDTLLGVRNLFGSVYGVDDDGSPVGNGLASGLGGVPTNSGSIDFSVTGYTDESFVGDHTEFGQYRVFIDVYDFFDDFIETITADRTMQPGVVDDFYYEGDFDWNGGSYDVYIDNTIGGAAADMDFFTFTGLSPGAAFTAQTADPLMSTVDTRLGWFDEFGSVIDVDDDSGAGFLSLLDGVVPASGMLTFGVTGQGDNDFLGDHNAEGTYELRLTLGGGLAADFDNSGGVRAADLALWRSNYGPSAVGDADGDNDTDGNDFLIWQRELGQGSGVLASAAAVPEPSAGALLGLALLCRGLALRRR